MTALCRRACGILLLIAWLIPVKAQDTALRLGSTIDAFLAPGETHQYSFPALEWTLVSLRVEALTEELDPRLEIFGPDGDLVIANDDYDYPATRDAALQAFLIPATATYRVAVSAVGDGGGDYRLHVLPGYDVLSLHDTVMDNANWEVVYSDAVVHLSDSSLFAAEMSGAARSAIILGLHLPLEKDVYFEASFESVSATSAWQVGLVFRYLAPDRFHRLLLSNRGFWTIERVNDGIVTDVRDWATHPAIVPGESDFRLGVLASGGHFDVVYNGQVVGSARDEMPADRGGLGLAVRSNQFAGGTVSFAVREAILTLPTRVEDKLIFPQRLLERRYFLMADELRRQQLVPANSEFLFTVGESSVRNARAGLTYVPLARESDFEFLALGASIAFNIEAGLNGGCGLVFHVTGDEEYALAYLTQGGDLGISRRVGAAFEPGLYQMADPFSGGSHYLLVIVADGELLLFADEHYAGSMPYPRQAGGIGIAVVNYEQAYSSCTFEDLWLLGLADLQA